MPQTKELIEQQSGKPSWRLDDDYSFNGPMVLKHIKPGWNLYSFPFYLGGLTVTPTLLFESMPLITQIIGQSVSSVKINGVWAGSVSSINPREGYWVWYEGTDVSNFIIPRPFTYGGGNLWNLTETANDLATNGGSSKWMLSASPWGKNLHSDNWLAFNNETVSLKASGTSSALASAKIIGTVDLDDEDGTNFILRNNDGSTVTFHTDPTKNFGDTSSDGGDHTWEVNTRDIDSVRKATQALYIACKTAIDAGELDMTIDPTSFAGTEEEFTLTQTLKGTSGNTAITLVTGVTADGETSFTGGSAGTGTLIKEMIGEGESAVYLDTLGWVGSLTHMPSASGIWILYADTPTTASSFQIFTSVGPEISDWNEYQIHPFGWTGSLEMWLQLQQTLSTFQIGGQIDYTGTWQSPIAGGNTTAWWPEGPANFYYMWVTQSIPEFSQYITQMFPFHHYTTTLSPANPNLILGSQVLKKDSNGKFPYEDGYVTTNCHSNSLVGVDAIGAFKGNYCAGAEVLGEIQYGVGDIPSFSIETQPRADTVQDYWLYNFESIGMTYEEFLDAIGDGTTDWQNGYFALGDAIRYILWDGNENKYYRMKWMKSSDKSLLDYDNQCDYYGTNTEYTNFYNEGETEVRECFFFTNGVAVEMSDGEVYQHIIPMWWKADGSAPSQEEVGDGSFTAKYQLVAVPEETE